MTAVASVAMFAVAASDAAAEARVGVITGVDSHGIQKWMESILIGRM